VNALWFSSLVFSVSASATSILGLAWTQSIQYVSNCVSPIQILMA
jgi:hypothetical protein